MAREEAITTEIEGFPLIKSFSAESIAYLKKAGMNQITVEWEEETYELPINRQEPTPNN